MANGLPDLLREAYPAQPPRPSLTLRPPGHTLPGKPHHTGRSAMERAYDLVIRGGTVIDGSGGPAREADVGVKDGLVAAVGQISGRGGEEIDARGKLVAPGFVDVHTHYDGQATWDSRMQPSSWHGVTTVVM